MIVNKKSIRNCRVLKALLNNTLFNLFFYYYFYVVVFGLCVCGVGGGRFVCFFLSGGVFFVCFCVFLCVFLCFCVCFCVFLCVFLCFLCNTELEAF